MARRLTTTFCAPWASGRPVAATARAPWIMPGRAGPALCALWAIPNSAWRVLRAPWVAARAGSTARALPWGAGQLLAAPLVRAPWVLSRKADTGMRSVIRPGADSWIGPALFGPWVLSHTTDMGLGIPTNTAPKPAGLKDRLPWGDARPHNGNAWLPWGMGIRIDQGVIIIITPPPDPDEPDPSTIVIPTRRTYIVINSASLKRVSNNLALHVSSISIAIDDGGVHWSWSASLPLAALADLEPDVPGELVELEAEVNGASFRLLVESVRDREAFGSSSLVIGGRGLAAELSAPAYPVASHDNTGGAANAQQLADAALSFNGVPLGWTLDWQAADWLVPAGVWVFSGTPIDAVSRIAAAAGAYVQAAPGARTLKVLPRYPVAPWDWHTATPAVILPAAAVLERGTEHAYRPAYNVVYVSGQAQGIRARVKRTGTAGDVAAEMIVDALVTHSDAAAGRGLEILGNTGAKRIVRLETGILPASGVIHVGGLMDWVRGSVTQRGLVRGVSISASVPGGRSKQPLIVRQTVEVETNG